MDRNQQQSNDRQQGSTNGEQQRSNNDQQKGSSTNIHNGASNENQGSQQGFDNVQPQRQGHQQQTGQNNPQSDSGSQSSNNPQQSQGDRNGAGNTQPGAQSGFNGNGQNSRNQNSNTSQQGQGDRNGAGNTQPGAQSGFDGNNQNNLNQSSNNSQQGQGDRNGAGNIQSPQSQSSNGSAPQNPGGNGQNSNNFQQSQGSQEQGDRNNEHSNIQDVSKGNSDRNSDRAGVQQPASQTDSNGGNNNNVLHSQQTSQDRNGYHNDRDNGGGIGGSGQTAIIAGCAAGAFLTLVVLAFIWWRKRRGATYADIVRFRKHTPSIPLEKIEAGNVAALSVSRNGHYSMSTSQPDALENPSTSPQTAEISPCRGSVAESNLWKSANPPLSSPEENAWPLADKPPVLIGNKSSPRLERQQDQPPRYQLSRTKNGSGLVCQKTDESTTSDYDETLKGPEDLRWSGTNSQAPSSPLGEAPNSRASLTSLTSRRFSNLMRNHSRIREEKVKSASAPKPLLKNHAATPILAPPNVGRKVSQKNKRPGHGRVGSLSMIFRPKGSGNSSP